MTIIFLRKGTSICAKVNILNLTKLTTCIWVLFYRLQSPLTIVFLVLKSFFCAFAISVPNSEKSLTPPRLQVET